MIAVSGRVIAGLIVERNLGNFPFSGCLFLVLPPSLFPPSGFVFIYYTAHVGLNVTGYSGLFCSFVTGDGGAYIGKMQWPGGCS